MKNEKNKIVICFVIATITLSLGAYFEKINYKIGIFSPHSWGILKGFIDPILIITFPWGGWIFLIPLLLALFLKLSIRTIFSLWAFVTLTMVVADSIISFQDASFAMLIKGIYIYMFIFGPFLIFAILIKLFVKGRKNES